MNCKKFVSFFLLLSITTTFLLSCDKADKNNITKENENVVTGTIEWTFDKLAEESDCCVFVSLFGPFAYDEEAISKKVGNNYYIDMWVAYYFERDRNFFPERITIIQEDEPFLETVDPEFSSSMYLLFLTKADEENTYYVTGGKNGVIRKSNPFFKAKNDNLNSELQEKFKDTEALENWLENNYKFSYDMIPDDSTWEYTTFPPDTTFSWDILSPSYTESYTTETQLETTTNPIDIP